MLMTAAFPVKALCQTSYQSPDVQVATVAFATPVLLRTYYYYCLYKVWEALVENIW